VIQLSPSINAAPRKRSTFLFNRSVLIGSMIGGSAADRRRLNSRRVPTPPTVRQRGRCPTASTSTRPVERSPSEGEDAIPTSPDRRRPSQERQSRLHACRPNWSCSGKLPRLGSRYRSSPIPEQTDETPGDQRHDLRTELRRAQAVRVNVVRFSDDGNRLVTAGQEQGRSCLAA